MEAEYPHEKKPHPLMLHQWAARGYSQLGADGILHKLFQDIGVVNRTFVEFGTQSGVECNTRRLRVACGWSGLLMDGGFDDPNINLHKEFITAENIVQLLQKYNVPRSVDLLSVDIDGNDHHVLANILKSGFAPRVIVVETNFQVVDESAIVKYNPGHRWDASCYTSASVGAFRRLLARYDHVASARPDTYWVRRDVPHPRYVVPNLSTRACERLFRTRGISRTV